MTESAPVENPFDENLEVKRWTVASLILTGRIVTWSEIQNAVGHFSPRSMGYVIRALEDQGATILKLRDAERGTMYRYEPEIEFDPRYRLSKTTGPDAQRQRGVEVATETSEPSAAS